ncbi:MAG TPA: hypothetical protein VIC06_04825 [Solirubrobacteraceae bacterium]
MGRAWPAAVVVVVSGSCPVADGSCPVVEAVGEAGVCEAVRGAGVCTVAEVVASAFPCATARAVPADLGCAVTGYTTAAMAAVSATVGDAPALAAVVSVAAGA